MEILVGAALGIFALLGAVVAVLLTLRIGEAVYYEGLLARALQRDLKFRVGSACLPVERPDGKPVHLWQFLLGDPAYIKSVAIESVAAGGLLEQAGFSKGDVLPDVTATDLFKLLHRHRGRVAELAVVDGGPGRPFCQRPRRFLRVAVPSRSSLP